MNLKRIMFGVSSAWLVLSLGAISVADVMLLGGAPATAKLEPPPNPKPGGGLAAVIARPPDNPPEMTPEQAAKNPELSALLYRYFPQPLSQHMEEAYIRDYFEDRKGGFFLDVGASHYKIRSNTYYMDVALGWHGIAIDAIAELAPDYVKHRPHTKFFPVFVSDKSDADVDFFVVAQNSRLSTADPKTAEKLGLHETRKLKTVTLNALLESQGVKKVDLINMDIEMWEPPALAGFDIDKYKPDLVVIEIHPNQQATVYDYFAKHGYVLLDKYTQWDGANAYFIPKDDLPKFLARKSVSGLTAAPSEQPQAAPAPSAPAAHAAE